MILLRENRRVNIWDSRWLGVRYTPSVGNFLLIDTGRDCEEDFVRLLHEGVIVRPMKLYSFPASLRVTIGTHSDNEQFLEALQRVVTTAGVQLVESRESSVNTQTGVGR